MRWGASERKADKRGAGKRGTTREYNANRLIYQPQRRAILDLISGDNQVIAEVDFGILAPCKLTCANSPTHRPLP